MNTILIYNTKGLSQIGYDDKRIFLSNYKDVTPQEDKLLILNSMFTCKTFIVEDFLNKVYRFSH